ncbi:hypothetical protein POUND7_019596 [Theobroma cacao]
MDSQDQGKNHSSGHESHGVHLCHKCGWPFPNQHPSARHRRAHKKICGNIEGYKLVDSGDITLSTASDDEALSDEDHQSPIAQVPKVLESDSLKKSISGIGAMSNRSEDEVFSDAAMEFHDGGKGRQDSLDNASKADKIAEKDLTATISFKDCEDTDILQPPQNPADTSQNLNAVLENIPIMPSGTPEHQDIGLSYSKDSDDRNGSACDVVLTKPETITGVSEESRKVSAVDRVAECSIERETDAIENEKGKLNKNLAGGSVLPSQHCGELSESVSVSERRLEGTSDTVLTDDIVQSKEEFSDRLASKIVMSENGEEETDGKGHPRKRNLMDVVASNCEYATITSEKREDITSESGLADKIVELEENTDKLALNKVIDNLSLKDEPTKLMDVSADTFQMKTDPAQATDSATSVNSNEVYEKEEKENESVYVLSVPDDIPIVDNAEIKLEGFKDHKGVKLPLLEALASEEIIIDTEDEVRDHVSQEISDTFRSNQLDENIKVDSSQMHDVEVSHKLGGDNEAMVKEVLVEGKADVLQINKGSDALGSPVDADTSENEKDHKVCSLEEQQPVYVSDDLHQTGFSGSMINVLPDVNPMVAPADAEARKLSNVVGSDDMGIPESTRIGAIDVAGSNEDRRIDDGNYVENTETLCESTNNSSLPQTNPASNLLEVDNSDDIGTRKAEKYDIDVVESGEGLEEGYISMKTNSAFESSSAHHQSPVVTEEVNNEYVRTLSETEGPQLDRVSNSQVDIKECEINRDNKVQGDCAGKDLMASALDHSGGNEFGRTSEDQLKKELNHLPSDAEPTSQSSGAVDDSHTRRSRVDASGISTVTLPGEADNGHVKHQLDTTVVDVSVESSSQTDSLEGHWGSVSVLSTQSDYPAVIDTETLPSTGSHALVEAEEDNIKKSKVASEGQHFDKSDEFEPPSFMTLVEPRGGDQKDAASEVQTAQNEQHPRAAPLQAGWFPSLAHVANESQGRKKNEEIIAKVTNWNAKQHTPLKNLLGEAHSETKPKSPNAKENPAVVLPREEKVGKDNGVLGTKVSSVLGPEAPVAEPTNMEAGKEWNSPARYPADIRREKRKVKGRPLWVQFVCCSSVN